MAGLNHSQKYAALGDLRCKTFNFHWFTFNYIW